MTSTPSPSSLDRLVDYLDALDESPGTWPRWMLWLALGPWWLFRPFAKGLLYALAVVMVGLAEAWADRKKRSPARLTPTGTDPRVWPVLFWLSFATLACFALAAVKHGWLA